ncbi:hypothetical protein J3P88_12090 [Pseudomonas sp. Z3-6]|uniref:hypothetical protein n=1 Tax=Pseudomonas sp. Z3-6 TaxID=2817411 RepID=UPI003DAA243C
MKLLSFDAGGPQRFGVWIARGLATLTLRLGGQSTQSLFNDEPLSFFAASLSVEDDCGVIHLAQEGAQARATTLSGADRYVPVDASSLYSHPASRGPK